MPENRFSIRTDGFLNLLLSCVLGLGTACFGYEHSTRTDVEKSKSTVVAISMNIRYDNPGDGKHAWPHRRQAVAKYLKEGKADFVGLQEATPPQLVQVAEALDEHAFIARTRKKTGLGGEATPLFWRVDRWSIDLMHQGTAWLSETPGIPGSKSWDSSLPRIVTWARFIEKETGQGIWVYNTHFDHQGREARIESGRLLARFIGDRKHVEEPVILMGDFNCTPESEPIRAMKEGAGTHPVTMIDAWAELNPSESDNATWNGWQNILQGRRIDLILVSDDLEVKEAEIERVLIDGRPISDHWPVRVGIDIPPKVTKGMVDD